MKHRSEHADKTTAEPKEGHSVPASSSSHLEADAADKAYWLSRTPYDRLRHMEVLRRVKYGSRTTERIQKVIRIVKLRDA